ncbi:hypothetical protein C8J27_11059 [Rhodobacter aestuarii]|uniref:Uncharacterized protein n=1 Tax=Rhodobacter aestuarii TaxID=453582 RepID=A0A1N7Q0T3_9RHOB|nr:hypothetical protein C8J27_11059 [Rhodobacter aestuarii]SIT16478.1 hypothetical protein SAMN05421580_11259 [Rhodobacter aestuarii]
MRDLFIGGAPGSPFVLGRARYRVLMIGGAVVTDAQGRAYLVRVGSI